jgi:integrase/recombinase XerD
MSMQPTVDVAVDPLALPPEAIEWLMHLTVERGRSSATISANRRDLRAWRAFLVKRGQDLADATADDIVAYVGSLRSAGRAPATVARASVVLRGFYAFLVSEELSDSDPAADVEPPSVPKGLPKALGEQDVAALIDAVQGDDPIARRDRAVLEVLYGAGLRISELVGLSRGDVDLGGALLRVFGKGSKERIVPIGRLALAALEDWLDEGGRPALTPAQWRRRTDSDAVFLNARGARITRQGAWGIVGKYGARVGLEDRLTPHVLRHSCATHMLDHGADIRTVQELLGHASISTTQIYTKVSTERMLEVYRSAHPRAQLTKGARAGAVGAKGASARGASERGVQ